MAFSYPSSKVSIKTTPLKHFVHLLSDSYRTIEKSQFALLAFDAVDHDILLQRLLVSSGSVPDWLASCEAAPSRWSMNPLVPGSIWTAPGLHSWFPPWYDIHCWTGVPVDSWGCSKSVLHVWPASLYPLSDRSGVCNGWNNEPGHGDPTGLDV